MQTKLAAGMAAGDNTPLKKIRIYGPEYLLAKILLYIFIKKLCLIDDIFCSPWTNMKKAAGLLNVTNRTAHKTIEKLVQAGILQEITGKARNRVYIATDILDVIEEDFAVSPE